MLTPAPAKFFDQNWYRNELRHSLLQLSTKEKDITMKKICVEMKHTYLKLKHYKQKSKLSVNVFFLEKYCYIL